MTEQQVLDLVKRSDRLSAREGVFSAFVAVIFMFISAVILVTSGVAESVPMVVTGTIIITIMSLVCASATGALLDRRHAKDHLQAVDAVRKMVKEKFSVELPLAERVSEYRSGQIIDTPEGRIMLKIRAWSSVEASIVEKLLPAVK